MGARRRHALCRDRDNAGIRFLRFLLPSQLFADYCLVIHLVLSVFQTAAAYRLKNCTEPMYLLGAWHSFGIVVPLCCGLSFLISQRLYAISFSDNLSIQ